MSGQPADRVVAAAIRVDGKVYSLPAPARHHDVIKHVMESGVTSLFPQESQGFLLSNGQFATRDTARRIAVENGQVDGRKIVGSKLTSEDLW